MRRTLPLMILPLALALTACDIRDDRPDFPQSVTQADKDAPYPDLAITSDLIAAGTSTRADNKTQAAASDRLRARASAMRARAARLRRLAQN